jgi:hypothetical protein
MRTEAAVEVWMAAASGRGRGKGGEESRGEVRKGEKK